MCCLLGKGRGVSAFGLIILTGCRLRRLEDGEFSSSMRPEHLSIPLCLRLLVYIFPTLIATMAPCTFQPEVYFVAGVSVVLLRPTLSHSPSPPRSPATHT